MINAKNVWRCCGEKEQLQACEKVALAKRGMQVMKEYLPDVALWKNHVKSGSVGRLKQWQMKRRRQQRKAETYMRMK